MGEIKTLADVARKILSKEKIGKPVAIGIIFLIILGAVSSKVSSLLNDNYLVGFIVGLIVAGLVMDLFTKRYVYKMLVARYPQLDILARFRRADKKVRRALTIDEDTDPDIAEIAEPDDGGDFFRQDVAKKQQKQNDN